MPNYYAHLKFGDKVLEGLPVPLRQSIRREHAAFQLLSLIHISEPTRPY